MRRKSARSVEVTLARPFKAGITDSLILRRRVSDDGNHFIAWAWWRTKLLNSIVADATINVVCT
jgi:hypothetical protein